MRRRLTSSRDASTMSPVQTHVIQVKQDKIEGGEKSTSRAWVFRRIAIADGYFCVYNKNIDESAITSPSTVPLFKFFLNNIKAFPLGQYKARENPNRILRFTNITNNVSLLLSFPTDSDAITWLTLVDTASQSAIELRLQKLEHEIRAIRLRMSDCLGGWKAFEDGPVTSPPVAIQQMVFWLSTEVEVKMEEARLCKESIKRLKLSGNYKEPIMGHAISSAQQQRPWATFSIDRPASPQQQQGLLLWNASGHFSNNSNNHHRKWSNFSDHSDALSLSHTPTTRRSLAPTVITDVEYTWNESKWTSTTASVASSYHTTRTSATVRPQQQPAQLTRLHTPSPSFSQSPLNHGGGIVGRTVTYLGPRQPKEMKMQQQQIGKINVVKPVAMDGRRVQTWIPSENADTAAAKEASSFDGVRRFSEGAESVAEKLDKLQSSLPRSSVATAVDSTRSSVASRTSVFASELYAEWLKRGIRAI